MSCTVYIDRMTEMHRRRGQHAGLSRAAVLGAARRILTAQGSGAVTIRAVARELQVAPNSLYSHVASRTALLDHLLDDLLADVVTPSDDSTDPLEAVQELMISTYDVLTAAPDLVPVYLTRQGARGPNAVRLGQVTDDLLQRACVDGEAVQEARRALIVHAIGAAAFAVAPGGEAQDQALSPDRLRAGFRRSLTWLVAGIATASQPVTR